MFETHKLNELGFSEVNQMKTSIANAVESALKLMPEGREKSIFKTKIEEAMFFATKAVASKAGNFTEVVKYTTL